MDKCFMIIGLLALVLPLPSSAVLRFNAQNKFRIVQFTDLHYGEGEDVWWGPVQDANSSRVTRGVLATETPDFVALTGDLITGNNIIDNATAYWKIMLTPMIEGGYHWGVAFGNHDDLASGSGGTRSDLMKFDQTFPLSMSQFGPADIHGVSNYYLPVYSTDGTTLQTVLWFFDAAGPGCAGVEGWACIMPDQVDWYLQTSTQLNRAANRTVPALAFFHIPLQEYMDMWNTADCYGTNNDSVACQALNTGLLAAARMQGDIQAFFVGHNHGNDFCGLYAGITLCYGRHSGYGGYGDWERGARVIELTAGPTWSMDTWIRYEDGRRVDEGPLHAPNGPPQNQCSY